MKIKTKISRNIRAVISMLMILILLLTAFPLTSLSVNAAALSQTKYDNITDFQKARWTQIQNAVFGQNYDSVQDASVVSELTVQSGNEFFNWTDTSNMQGYDNDGNPIDGGLQPYGTYTVTEVAEYQEARKTYVQTYVDYKGEEQTVKSLAPEFHCYNVYTADQFVFVLEQMGEKNLNTKINLCADIDMGGMQNKDYATGRQLRSHLYIEGNGHTVYNWKMNGTSYYFGLFGSPEGTKNPSIASNTGSLVVKNLGIQSAMLLHQNSQNGAAAGFFFGGGDGNACGAVLFDNVHMNRMFFQQNGSVVYKDKGQGMAFFGGRGQYRNNLLMNNCSTSNGYIYGTDHIGGMFSFTTAWGSYSGNNLAARYDIDFPECPEAIAYANYYSNSYSACPYPVYFNNSYSVDCEMFSTGNDSGMFVSCGGNIVARNCYTNNTMYANSNTAGFIGRVHHCNQEMYDDNGKQTIGSYFKNCYTAGTVEGKMDMGGFTGLDNGYRSSANPCTRNDSKLQSRGTTVYSDCYSTTMVGMDYTGRYCGGFIGFDDSYISKNASVTASDGQKINNIYGSVYMNCYAAGEVGNIMTVSDTEKATNYDYNFNGWYSNTDEDMSNYYPTGGFIGMLNQDAYYITSGFGNRVDRDRIYGYFYNCYYDMQTTGMHEMAIGLAYAETCRDDTSGKNIRYGDGQWDETGKQRILKHKDAYGNEMPFSVIGITGVYTEKSDVKNVAGLTGSPVEYKDANGNVLSRMSMSSENYTDTNSGSDVWQYNEGYYPQLKVFMASDTDVSDFNQVTEDKITDAVKGSVFYVEVSEEQVDDSGNVTKAASHPVLSLANSTSKLYEDYYPNTNIYAAQLAGVVSPYRYAQASTATVKLNHWDYKMNTADGSLSTDNDWACAVKSNELKLNPETGFFENTYTGLAAGKYEFKVQANNTMAYNYGANKFDGQNCVLSIPVENCSAKIMFRYSKIRSQNYQIYAVLSDSKGNYIDEYGNPTSEEKRIFLGGTEVQIDSETWTLVGTLPNALWEVANSNYDLKMSNVDASIYSYTCDFEPDKDEEGNYKETECQFKIAKDHAWTESYGIAGKSDNMSFKFKEPCTVYFEFNNKTHITTAKATKGEIYKVFTDKTTEYDFKGLSIIGQQSLTGYNWLESGKELEAAEKGKLKETSSGSGIYTVSFDNVKMGQNYAYKLIKDAVDSGANSYFSIKNHLTDPDAVCTVTFTYDSHTKETSVSAKLPNDSGEYANPTVDVRNFSVIGSEELTGYFWLGDKDHPADQSEESKENYKKEAVEAGLMDPVAGSDSLYRKTFPNVKKGTYAFKVGANGSLDMSWGENGSSENYTFTLTKAADVTVTFNKAKQTISVSTDPTDALDIKEYVVTGTQNLMGKTWNLYDAVMTYNEEDGVYEYTKQGVPTGQNYAFKIIEKGRDSGENISFSLAGNVEKYDIEFIYNPKNGAVTQRAFDPETGEEVTDYAIKPVQIKSYSVLGDKGLTGYNWLGLTDKGTPGTLEDEQMASEQGAMTVAPDGSGTYTKTYTGIKVGTNGETLSYPFKIAANGNWDSGISYGDDNGGNYMLILNGDTSGVTECDVTINFDPSKSENKITVITNPSDCNMSDVDDSKFTWYVVGDYKLVSYESFRASAKVYDTVRDITSDFSFTTGADTDETGVVWKINSKLNKKSDFYDRIGGNGFSLDYTVDGKTSTGTFNTPIVDLALNIEKDSNGKYIANYNCSSFMPGKQWLTISSFGDGQSAAYTKWKSDRSAYEEYSAALEEFNEAAEIYYKVLGSALSEKTPSALVSFMQSLKNGDEEQRSYYDDLVSDYGDILSLYDSIRVEVTDPGISPEISDQPVIGSRNLRLIPTVYLEAGNDADVAVYQSDSNPDDCKNIVNYSRNSSADVTFSDIDGKSIDKVGFGYYNFAFSAAYAITDQIGLGIYQNYENQNQTTGDRGIKGYDKALVREQNDNNQRTNPNTFYAMTSVFTESSKYSDENGSGLVVDALKKQSLIGSSYDYNSADNPDGDKKQYGQTIVKVYRVNDHGLNSKVNMSSTAAETSDEYINYMKWTGQTSFTAEDKGEYNVTFYWALSDGRYLSDTKHVTVKALKPGISKSVDVAYDEAGDNTLTYTVTYTNSDFASPVNFGILDVLPYSGDARLKYGDDENSGTTGSDVSFDLKKLKIKQSGTGTVRGVYYSTDKAVRSYLTDSDGKATENSAKCLDVDTYGKITDPNNYWNDISRPDIGGGGTFTPDGANGVTALAVSGIQLGVSESITLSITLEYKGEANDNYVNNAFFYAYDEGKSNSVVGYSKPVTTSIVGRSLNGYVWFDKNINGLVDSSEPRFKDVTVSLYKFDNSAQKYIDTGISAKTDVNGYYSFVGLEQGDFEVVVDGEINKILNADDGSTYKFDSLDQSKKLLEAKAEDVIGSRNIALAQRNSEDKITSFYVKSNMPTPAEIYRRSYTNNINAKCDGYCYTKSYVNIGMTSKKCSITLYKKGENNELLNGVGFILEWFNNGEWEQLKYDETGYIYSEGEDGAIIDTFVTGEKMPDGSQQDGMIYLPNLPEGKFRLREVKPAEGYQPIYSPIEVELPYKIKTTDIEDYKNNPVLNPSNIKTPDLVSGDYSYYRDVTFTVSNNYNLNRNLPNTGSDNLLPLFIIGGLLIVVGLAVILYNIRRKRDEAPVKQ